MAESVTDKYNNGVLNETTKVINIKTGTIEFKSDGSFHSVEDYEDESIMISTGESIIRSYNYITDGTYQYDEGISKLTFTTTDSIETEYDVVEITASSLILKQSSVYLTYFESKTTKKFTR